MPEHDLWNARHTSSAPPSPEVATANGEDAPGPLDANGDATATLRQELRERIASALRGFQSVTASWRGAADAMDELGVPPSYQVLHALGECHRQFLRLRLDVTNRLAALGLAVPPINDLIGLNDLSRLVETVLSHHHPATARQIAPEKPEPAVTEELIPPPTAPDAPFDPLPASEPETHEPPPPIESTHVFKSIHAPAPEWVEPVVSEEIPEPSPEIEHPGETVRRSALEVLDRALSLTTRDGSGFSPLAEFLESSRVLRAEVSSAPADSLPDAAALLASRAHPIADLLIVIDGVEGLTDAQWASLHTQVTETFGRQMAVAAARGRFVPGAAPVG